MRSLQYHLTDVFTSTKYGGNPLATFVDCGDLGTAEMQSIAKEINYSETTFVTAKNDSDQSFQVRIFTPNSEVEFAGHPTLGTAHVIQKIYQPTSSQIRLDLKIGRVEVTCFGGQDGYWMKQPAPAFGKEIDRSLACAILGVAPSALDPEKVIEEVSTGFPTMIVPVSDLETLRSLRIQPETYDLYAPSAWAKIILAYSREPYRESEHFSVRVFGRFYGIAEDAATGSSNGALAAYLCKHDQGFQEASTYLVGQGHEMNRPSELRIKARRQGDDIQVEVGGCVVDVARGFWD